VIAPIDAVVHRAGADDATLILGQVFVREAPVPLDVDHAHAVAEAAWLRPGPARVDSTRSGIEIALPAAEVIRAS